MWRNLNVCLVAGDEADVEFDGEDVRGIGLSESEELVIQKFLLSGMIDCTCNVAAVCYLRRCAGPQASRTLADIIMEKIKEKTEKSTLTASFC
jgi:hypothetical protein